MGYYSRLRGVVRFNRPLTQEEAVKFGTDCLQGHSTRDGREDWTLTADFSGITCAWEGRFKAYESFGGLKKLLAESLPSDVVANGFIRDEGQENEDISIKRVVDGKLTTLGAHVVTDIEAFAAAVAAALAESPQKGTHAAVLDTLKTWEEPEPESAETLNLEDFLAVTEEDEAEGED